MTLKDRLKLAKEIDQRNAERLEAWKKAQREHQEAQQKPTDKPTEKEQGP